ncbi:MAG: response regulator [Verrucomicrobia bacterium]|nr:response regulator [Verrucomicrobiota bacterium]
MQPASANGPIRVLLVEDDEDDYILACNLMGDIARQRYQVDWHKTFDSGLAAAVRNRHDVCLFDYRLGARNGVELLRTVLDRGCRLPIILLTSQGEHEIDLEAMRAGADDYLVKGKLDAGMLERSIRYAIERKRAVAQAAANQARLAAFGADIGLALTQRDALRPILQRCAAAMLHYLKAVQANIWVCDPDPDTLRLHASAGLHPSPQKLEFQQSRVALDLKALAAGQPVLIPQLRGDARLLDREWARRERLVSFAAHPLRLEDRLVGLMTLFSRQLLTGASLQEMASVANGIALCIERKRSEEALGASEIKYRSVVENIKEVIFQLDQDARWTFLNPAWTEITGFKIRDTLGTPFTDYVHPEDLAGHRELMLEVISRTKSFCRDEVRYLAKDGTFRWMEVYAQPLLDTPDSQPGASGTLSDITERKRAAAEIEKLAAFARYNPDPVMELAADGTLTYFNQAARDMAAAMDIPEPGALLPPDAPALVRECLRTGQSRLRHEMLLQGRTLTWSFFPILSSQVVHCYGVDNTERLALEAQLRHSQKLESIGQLAAGVAHDFNNILTIIEGHADRLLARCDAQNPSADPLHQISAAAKRASALTRQLLVFSRKQVLQPRVLDLNAVLGNLTTMLQRLLGDDIALESFPAPGLPPMEGDAGMIEQVILNLVVNSRDAMPKGGRLVITTTAVDIDADHAQHHPDARPGRHLCLSVSDTGHGMPRDTLDRIFEPFFTTKEVGKGTGLGLATVYGIVKQHQGWIRVASELNAGTTFKIYLPATSKPLEPHANPSADPPALRGRHETVLLVEDEPVLRELARVVLSEFDYRVLEAASGHEALKVWDEHGGNVDVLLTDMIMPQGMNGRELAEELKSRKPTLKIIFTSGYSPEIMGRDMTLHDCLFLQKPYPPPLLAQTVRACLDHANN